MMNVKPFRQKPGYCGPASLKIVLEVYGCRKSEKKLVELSGCSTAGGVGAEGLQKAAETLGFKCFFKDYSELSDIRRFIKKGIPVIVDWFDDGGHYSVVTGMDKENIYMQDPGLGYERAMKLKDFKTSWFDFPNSFLRSKDELIIRRMIVVYPKKNLKAGGEA